MKTTRRGAALTLVALGIVGVALAAEEPPAILESTAFEWTSIPAKETAVGAVRQFVRAPTATLDELELHVTTLDAGQTSHPPHRHPNEELVIVREGTVEALVQGEWKRVGPGSVIFNAANQLHGLKNVGTDAATYFVINWSSPGTKRERTTAPSAGVGTER